MSTLYIRLPSKAVADNAAHWIALPCPYALASGADSVEREGQAALPDLATLLAGAQRVVLLLAASDVTLLHVKIPPMSAARMRVALPNLVEEQLMSDPADCVMVAADSQGSDNTLRTVAVMQRSWLQILLQTVAELGARHVVAVPSQLCLAKAVAGAAAVVTQFGLELDLDLTLRLSEHDALGLPLLPDDPATAAQDVVQTLCAIVPTAPIELYVPQQQVPMYQQAVTLLLPLEQRVTVLTDHWGRWIAGARSCSLSLGAGLSSASGAAIDWRQWRWPLVLGSLVLLLNIGALNFEWWRLSREAAALRTSMVQIYKSTYPRETVIVDPMAQMRQKIAAAQRDAGQPAPDDFAVLAAGFAQAWDSRPHNAATPGSTLSSVEYREHSLLVKPKPQAEVPLAQMKAALASRNLTLTQSQPGIWQIRSAK